MQKENPFFDDLSKLASSAAGAMMDMRRELEQMVAEQCKQLMHHANLVTQEEFDVVKSMAEKARLENEELKSRIEALEGQKPSKAAARKKAD